MVEDTTDVLIPIQTANGVRHVRKEDIIHFPDGLLGFREFTDFVFFDIVGCEPFKSMLSVEESGPDFVVVESLLLFDDYAPMNALSPVKNFDFDPQAELTVLSIVTLAEDPKDITVNLRGPLFVNLTSSTGKQVILDDERYLTKVPVLAKNRK